jgi:hypothetical protein
VKKQRVAIEGVYSLGSGTGTFKLTPLSAGPLKADAGTLKTIGLGSLQDPPAPFIRNGQSRSLIVGSDVYTGRRGSFTVAEKDELVNAGAELPDGSRYGVSTGTWKLGHGTGAYAGIVGKGADAAILFPKTGKNLRFSLEGIVQSG